MRAKRNICLYLSACALVLSSCGSSSGSAPLNTTFEAPVTPLPSPTATPVPTPTPTPVPTPVPTPTPAPSLASILVSHPWCETHANAQGQSVQDRMGLTSNGQITYQEFAYQNGQRIGSAVFSYVGTWRLSGSTLAVAIMGQQVSAAMTYSNPDPATGHERLHATYNGQNAPYDPCN